MPAIRDSSFAYEGTTTDGGLTIPMCAYEVGDLLFAILVGDTGTPTVGVTGSPATWNQLFQNINTCSMTVLWRYAVANEVDIVMTASVTETYSGCVVAVRDVFQGYTTGSPPLSTNTASTGTAVALPTITTSGADSLVLALISSSGTSSVSFIQSALQDLVKVDGTAEGFGVGWFFKKAAGLTTAYVASLMASAAGGKAVIECRAPVGGATVIPAYPVSDASILLTPSPGVAYDSNTAIAATADTTFGTSIGGKTCNDGTIAAAVADIGIDTGAFMSFAGITNTAVANQMSGAQAVVAASRYNIGTRNILCHFRHAAPSSNQRLSPVSSGRGVWFGLKSGATTLTDYKIWQVHGSDAPMPPGNTRPFIVNPSNTDTVATAGTLVNTDVRNYGFWTGGLGILTQQAAFGPMWAMDTTVIAGGSTIEPVDIPGIVASAALNKVRYSSLLQGSNQMLCLQAIQFGDGGTNPINLRVNGGAVEFPTRKNAAKKIVNYNGVDDSVGWTFYPGASDTIDLEGTAFAANNKFHWRFHASASASATYKLSGVAVNGAGDVQLRPVTTFSGISFTNCPTITLNGATVDSCTFTNSKVTAATPAGASLVSNCTFTKTTGTSYAMEVTGTAATINLVGNTFTGYAATNGTTGNEAIFVNIATGSLTINISGGGNTPSIRTAGAVVTVQNAVSLTIEANTSLVGAEVRIYDLDNTPVGSLGTELSGTESNATATYVYSGSVGNSIWVQIMKSGYEEFGQQTTMPSVDGTFTATLKPDSNA